MNTDGAQMRQRLFHAYIIASPDVDAREKKALELACTLVCFSQDKAPCMACPQCKKAISGINPDVIVLGRKTDEKGKLKREIQVDQIRALTADAWVRPQEADRKVYIISDAGYMNAAAQNAALKLLEEPPAYAAFILCADSAQTMLATIRSRCVVINLPGERGRSDNELAREYIALAEKRDRAALCTFCSRCEALDGEQLTGLIEAVCSLLYDIISLRRDVQGTSRANALRLLALCERAREYLNMNVGVKHVLSLLCVRTVE